MSRLYVVLSLLLAFTFSGCDSSNGGETATAKNSPSAIDETNFVNLGDVVDSYGSPQNILSNSSMLDGVKGVSESGSSISSGSDNSSESVRVSKSLERVSAIQKVKELILKRVDNSRSLKNSITNSAKMEGSVSGYSSVEMVFDTETETITEGKITFVDFIDEEEYNEELEEYSCSDEYSTKEEPLNGEIKFSMEELKVTMSGNMKMYGSEIDFSSIVDGVSETSKTEIVLSGDIKVDDTTIKDGTIIVIDEASDEVRTTINSEIEMADKRVKFIDYVSVEVDDWEKSRLSTYPLSGDIAISNDEVNGYFSVDSSYNHKATPTVKDFSKDICKPEILSGEEHYIGKNSSLVWRVESLNNCLIELDRDGDGEIDETIEDNCF